MSSSQCLFPPNCENHRPVEIKGRNSSPSHAGHSHKNRAFPAKMCPPVVVARREDADFVARIRIAHVQSGGLSQRARDTSECQIAGRCRSPGAHRNDMIDVKRCFLSDLRKPTIFASVLGASDHRSAKPLANHRHDSEPPGACRSARNRRTVSVSASSTNPSASARSWDVRASPRS